MATAPFTSSMAFEAGEVVGAVDVHRARAADALAAGAAEGEGGIDLVLDLDQRVQHHRPAGGFARPNRCPCAGSARRPGSSGRCGTPSTRAAIAACSRSCPVLTRELRGSVSSTMRSRFRCLPSGAAFLYPRRRWCQRMQRRGARLGGLARRDARPRVQPRRGRRVPAPAGHARRLAPPMPGRGRWCRSRRAPARPCRVRR